MALALNEPSSGPYHDYVRRKRLVIAATFFAVVALALASLAVGSAQLSPADLVEALAGKGDDYNRIVVWKLRMPHVLCAVIGGIALAGAGCSFQSVLRNPLASASTLGVAQGAAFGASVAIIVLGAGTAQAHEGVTFSNPYLTAACAFGGALISSLTILALARIRDLAPESIVLAGVALSALFTAATAMLQYFAEDTQVAAVVFWTFGSLRHVTYNELAVMALVTAATYAFFHVNRWNCNALESGEGSAHSLGVNVKGLRLAGMLVGTLAASTIIAFCGTINFIGLVAPHIMRRLIGNDYRYLFPASALTGACLMLASDLAASTIAAPVVLPISAVTSFIGAPLFLYLLIGRNPR